MRFPKFRSIWMKTFILIFVIMILPIIAFSFVAQKINLSQAMEQKQKSDMKSLSELNTTLSIYMDSVETLGNLIVADESIRQFIEQAAAETADDKAEYKQMDSSRYLNKYQNIVSSVISISLMDADGFFIGEQRLNPDRLYYYFNSTYMSTVNKDAITWSDPFSIQFNQDDSISRILAVQVPCKDKQGELSGFAILYVDVTCFKNFIAFLDDEIYILDASNYVITSKEDVPHYYNLYKCREINYSLLIKDDSVIIYDQKDPVIVTTYTYDRAYLQFVLVSSYNEFRKEVNQNIPGIPILAIFVIFLSFLLSAFISKIITVPIVRLKSIMSNANENNLGIRYKTEAKDEIAELGKTFNSLMDTIQRLIAENMNRQQLQQKLQLQLIQEQVKPHFLYNVLEMISSLIQANLTEKAIQSIQHLSNFYRISLNSGSDIISIESEMKLLDDYLNLQRLRYIEFIDFTLSFHPSIYQYAIPKLTLQPIVENAIYHGLREKCEKGILSIVGYMEDNRIVFEIFDTGCGLSEEKLKELKERIYSDEDIGNHFGLASVVKRLNLFCNNQASLKIDSKLNEYTCVTITFPAIKES